MASLRDLLRRASHYASATVVSILCGLISYPLFTRKLEVEDYGAMGLIQVILLGGIAVAKLGLQNSIIRLWPAYDRDDERRGAFAATYFYTGLTLGLLAAIVCAGVALALRSHLPARLVWPLTIAALLIPTRALFSFAQNFLRARERSRPYALVSVGNSVLGLIFAATLVVWVMPGAWRLSGFYLGLLGAEALVVVLALRASFRGMALSPGGFDLKLVREGLWFGAPLILFEFSSILLGMGDRVIIEIFWSERQLGFYTAAFSLAWQISTVYAQPFEMAVVPAYTNLFEKEGAASTRDFLAKVTRLYYLGALPIIAGLWAVREDIIVVFASQKYREAQAVLPILIAGFLVYGARSYVGAGLFLAKQSRLSGIIAAGGALLNVGLNLALVPRYGIEGSAVATAIGMFLVVVVMAIFGGRAFAFDLSIPRLLLYAAASAAMGWVVTLVRFVPANDGTFTQHLTQLVTRIGVGIGVYAAFALAVEPAARELAGKLLRRLWRR
jgi:O-antigen/teichoic acid export membrane protein